MSVETALAVDSDPRVMGLYQKNFPDATAHIGDVSACFDGALGAKATDTEETLIARVGAVAVLQGGPPCQGHSDLNNHTRRQDPRNALYLKMARAAEVLKPSVVIIENVAPVQWDKSGVVRMTKETLEAAGYSVTGKVMNLQTVGVPQRRLRYVLVASRIASLNPAVVFSSIADTWGDHRPRTVHWAIADLDGLRGVTPFDTASERSDESRKRIAYLFKHRRYDLPNDERPECHRKKDHSYNSVYGRLRWDKPAQTITTGFGSMGQGRYVHPRRWRTITPHEAARLQTFPDWFEFGNATRRGVLVRAIGNAVPPLLMVEIGRAILPALAACAVERMRA